MNIKITKEEYLVLNQYIENSFIIGSRLYGNHSENSDIDVINIIKPIFESDKYLPNFHQFQYDDLENNKQEMFITRERFFKNLFSGDSTINTDIIMFTNFDNLNEFEKLNYCRTYNIIKAFLGFAKRDLNNINKGKNKRFHAARSIYCAEELINNRLPKIEEFKKYIDLTIHELLSKCAELREVSNKLLNEKDLTPFPKELFIKPLNSLEQKLIESNNILEFKYF
jgi:hypothetical protein